MKRRTKKGKEAEKNASRAARKIGWGDAVQEKSKKCHQQCKQDLMARTTRKLGRSRDAARQHGTPPRMNRAQQLHRLPCRRRRATATTGDELRKPMKRRRNRSAAVTKKPTKQEDRIPHVVARSRARAAPRNRKSNGEEHIVGGRGMQEGTSPRFGRGGAERRRTAGMALTARPSSLGEVTKCYAVV